MIKCIAIDDQLESIEGLEQYIMNTPNMRLVATYTDPMIALREIKKMEHIDLIFMDIEMPRISGLELAQALRSKTRKLIFTTSHREFAFEAFQADADGYLLKPYSYAKFGMIITRLFEEELSEGREESYFLVKNKSEEHKAIMVHYDEIVCFESFHNYIKIHTNSKTIIAYLTLKDVREQLNIKKGFIQLHRGYIVAIPHIKHIDHNRVTLTNDVSFTVGDIYYKDFREFMSETLIISNRKK